MNLNLSKTKKIEKKTMKKLLLALFLIISFSSFSHADTLTVTDFSIGRRVEITYFSKHITLLTAEIYTKSSFSAHGISYCVDPTQFLHIGEFSEYEFVLPSEADITNTTAIHTKRGGLLASWLVDHYSPRYTNDNYLSERDEITALSIAVWEVITDEIPDITSGNFVLGKIFSRNHEKIISRVNYFLNSLPTEFPDSTVKALDSKNRIASNVRYQDLVISSAATPEPSSSLLVVSAFGLVFIRNKKST